MTIRQANSVPIGAEFGEGTYEKNFASGVNHHLLLFISPKAEDHKETTATFKNVAKEFKGKVIGIYILGYDELNHSVNLSGLHAHISPIISLNLGDIHVG